MPLISDKDKELIRQRLEKELTQEVTVSFFTQGQSKLIVPGQECPLCEQTRQLLEEVAPLSPKIRLAVYDFQADKERVAEFGVDKIPATIIHTDQGYGVKYYGMPAGYEFATFLDGLLLVARGSSPLAAETKEELKKVDKDIHLQVFVTPT